MNYSGPPLNVENMTSLKVNNLSCLASCDALKHILQDFVPIVDMYIPGDRSTTESHGYALVHFHNKHDAEKAMNALNGIELNGHNLRVQLVDNEGFQVGHNGHYQEMKQWQCDEKDNENQSHNQKHQYTRRSNVWSLSRSQNTSYLGQSPSRLHYPSHRRSTRMSNLTPRSCVETRTPSRPRSLLLRCRKKFKSSSPISIACKCPEGGDVPTGDSERGHFTSFQQSENIEERELLGQDFLMSITHNNLCNHNVSGGMCVNLNNENISPQNDYKSSAGLESNINIHNQLDNPESESTFTRQFRSEINITLMDDPPIIDGRRIRYWDPETQITGVNNESTSPQNHMNDALLRFHYYISPETFDTIRENDAEIFSSIQPNFPLNENTTMSRLQSGDIFPSSPNTTNNNELGTLGPTNSTTHFDLGGTSGPEREHPLTVTSVMPRSYCTFESDWEERINMTSHFNQTNIQSYTEIHVHETSNSGLYLTTSLDNYGGSGQVMTGHSSLHPGQNNEINESTSENIIYDDNSNSSSHRAESSLSFTDISNLTLAEIIRHSSRSRQSNSHSSEISIVRNAANLYEIPSIVREQNQHTSSVIADENDSWPLPPFLFNITEDNFNQSAGLNKQQINNFAVRDYCEDDALNVCSVCITEYTEGCKIRILPCFHEYHDHCIDRWLSENATCPICRRQLKISDDMEF
uniref:E3 ubiquitin-protein ligase RLIM-like n=1 Tax=Jaculus jaculus TaxID=51337 RepID=UPI0003334254|nr:E3 ubiquitin-protein ligase RLIM-like [Jaculus jaculus]